MFATFMQMILDLLLYLHKFTNSYGWDIILLTFIVRMILLPLTLSGMKGMKAMQVAQPRIKELQEKYKDDKEKMNKEMMALYKEIGFNPMSSCLPLVLQFPVFIALYRVLSLPELNGYILVNESFYGMNLTSAAFTKLSPDFLKDLTLIMPGMVDLSNIGIPFFQGAFLYTPVLIVVALMTVTTIMQQKMMTVDPQQQSTMWIMNIFIVYISFIMPAGVLLYWGVSNLLQFAQQALTKGPDKKVLESMKAKEKKKGGKKEQQSKARKKESSSGDNIEKAQAPKKSQASEPEDTGEDESTDKSKKEDINEQLAGTRKTYPAQKKGSSKKKKKKKKKK